KGKRSTPRSLPRPPNTLPTAWRLILICLPRVSTASTWPRSIRGEPWRRLSRELSRNNRFNHRGHEGTRRCVSFTSCHEGLKCGRSREVLALILATFVFLCVLCGRGFDLKIEGTQTIAAPRQRVFTALVDPDVLQRCIPGCEQLEKSDGN